MNKRYYPGKMFRRPGLLMAALLLPVVLPAGAAPRAAGDQFKMNIHITGTVIATGSCKFNQGQSVDVSFDTVRYSTAGSHNTLEGTYIRPVPAELNCSGDTEGKTHMTFSSSDGTSVDWQGSKVLNVTDDSTGKANGLGIRLMVNGQPQDINTDFTVDIQSPPKIEAELVQTGDGSQFVSGNTFTASATLTMAFD